MIEDPVLYWHPPHLTPRILARVFATLVAFAVATGAGWALAAMQESRVLARTRAALFESGRITYCSMEGETRGPDGLRIKWTDESWVDFADGLSKTVYSTERDGREVVVTAVTIAGLTTVVERDGEELLVFTSQDSGWLWEARSLDPYALRQLLASGSLKFIGHHGVDGKPAYCLRSVTKRRGAVQIHELDVSTSDCTPLRLLREVKDVDGRGRPSSFAMRFRKVRLLDHEEAPDAFELAAPSSGRRTIVRRLRLDEAAPLAELYYLGRSFAGFRWAGVFEYRRATDPDAPRPSGWPDSRFTAEYTDKRGRRLHLLILPSMGPTRWTAFTASTQYKWSTFQGRRALVNRGQDVWRLVVAVGSSTVVVEAPDQVLLHRAATALQSVR